eukprot:CAMPEP_0182915454 /NCGR_PEP_ID=MMETSP0105_2-20130417/341_1 /TAXON_ID=81532 ORGANISM="Acanthoeca-like sp., Strain 10tr" /NCGR_SAMPLE_ID=MMETSP0105_2 /ASSEMBLY_ACC=CAM_ASM_000205 /LENGTH=369 /DNA_ID=CAMNT_0025052321 /DNA_START=179 /DNA_END=1288 /DNA_ORIENTATION=+
MASTGVTGFLKRHKWKIGLAGTGIGAYFLKRYLEERVAEMEREVLQDHLARSRREEHFTSNEKCSSNAVEKFLPRFAATLEGHLGIKALAKEMQSLPKTDKAFREKNLAMWRQLMCRQVTGVVAGAYLLSLVVVFFRVQFSILGGYAFLSLQPDKKEQNTLDPAVQREFLALVKHLQVEGTRDLVEWVAPVVSETLGAQGIDGAAVLVNGADVQKVLVGVVAQLGRMQRAGDAGPFTRFLLPEGAPVGVGNGAAPGGATNPPTLGHLIKETRDVLDAPIFDTAAKACVDKCIAHVIEGITMSMDQMTHDVEVDGPEGKPFRWAHLLKPIKDQCTQMLDPDVGPLHELYVTHAVKQLSVSVYESFSEVEQ